MYARGTLFCFVGTGLATSSKLVYFFRDLTRQWPAVAAYGGNHDVETFWERNIAGGGERQEEWDETAGGRGVAGGALEPAEARGVDRGGAGSVVLRRG